MSSQDLAAVFSPDHVSGMRDSYAPKFLSKSDLLADEFLLVRDGKFSVYYAPLETVPAASAKIVFVGLTPGLTQVQQAAAVFRASKPMLRDDP